MWPCCSSGCIGETVWDRPRTGKCWRFYKRQTDNDSIPGDLPQGTVVAHKTGEVSDVRHDGGIVYTPKGAYVLVIFTRNYTPYETMADCRRRSIR